MPRRFTIGPDPLTGSTAKFFSREELELWASIREDIIFYTHSEDSKNRTEARYDSIGFHGLYILNEPFNKPIEELEEELELPARSLKGVIKTLLLILHDRGERAPQQDQDRRSRLGI